MRGLNQFPAKKQMGQLVRRFESCLLRHWVVEFIKQMSFGDSEYLYLLSHPPESELSRWQTRLENDGLGETSGVRILRSPPYRLLQQNLIKENGINIFIR